MVAVNGEISTDSKGFYFKWDCIVSGYLSWLFCYNTFLIPFYFIAKPDKDHCGVERRSVEKEGGGSPVLRGVMGMAGGYHTVALAT